MVLVTSPSGSGGIGPRHVVDGLLARASSVTGVFLHIPLDEALRRVFLALIARHHKAVKEQKITWRRIILCGVSACCLFRQWWLLALRHARFPARHVLYNALNLFFYRRYICLLMAACGCPVAEDRPARRRVQVENESYMQGPS